MAHQVAHFLQTKYIWNSPPNDAMTRAYKDIGYEAIFYAPNAEEVENIRPVYYSVKWLLRNTFNPKWAKYAAFSCTSEDPIFVAGVLSFVWRKPLIFLSDEIKSGSYSGNRSGYWKKVCRWAMRRAKLTIVNDESRIELQRGYANLSPDQSVGVYPGCFLEPPVPVDQSIQRNNWGVAESDLVLCFSGACNLTAGIDWALESLSTQSNVNLVVQPLAMDEIHKYLLKNHLNRERIFIQEQRLDWQQSWRSMGGADIGIAIYINQAPQFQNMGISSNRLCMFLAMGVPVIVNKQESFQFVEDYNCGVMVENQQEFFDAIKKISNNLETMKKNTQNCMKNYVSVKERYSELRNSIQRELIK